jgi:hypothetical protein
MVNRSNPKLGLDPDVTYGAGYFCIMAELFPK